MKEQAAAAGETVWVPLMGLTRTEQLEVHPRLPRPLGLLMPEMAAGQEGRTVCY